ncbi:MAG TPA: hypothetical protein P5555_20875 [Candidatus Paceibacterota bacterium]|nr:hypothetical protein [Verrucomicrobiota bacterium]HRZ47636.1 hypothetical protein [Candidatus Paceibacterota bacterium]
MNLGSLGQNSTPTAIVGPPASGTHVLAEFWRDALGGEFRCTAAATPGTWIQIRPAAVMDEPIVNLSLCPLLVEKYLAGKVEIPRKTE